MAQSLDTEGAGKAGSGDVVLSNWTNAGRKDESATIDKGQAALVEYINTIRIYCCWCYIYSESYQNSKRLYN